MKATKKIKRIERVRVNAFCNWELLILCDDGFAFSVRDSASNRAAYSIGRDVGFDIRPRGK